MVSPTPTGTPRNTPEHRTNDKHTFDLKKPYIIHSESLATKPPVFARSKTFFILIDNGIDVDFGILNAVFRVIYQSQGVG